MKNHTRTAIIAASLLLSLTVASCGDAATDNTKTDGQTDTAQATEAVTEDPFADEKARYDALPALDLGGAEFVIAAQAGVGNSETEIYIEEADGDVIHDAVYKRNLAINERFHCEIRVNGCAVTSTVKQAVQAGDASYPLAFPNISEAAVLGQENYLMNFHDFDVIDLSGKWWDQGTANMDIGGRVFFMSGDINILDNDVTYIMLFNKQLISDNDMEEPYQLVRDGTWTIDAFAEMCKNISMDVNGDALMDENDRYGYVTTQQGPNTFFYGSDLKYVEFDSNHVPYLQVDSTKVTQVLEKVVNVTGQEHQVSYLPKDPPVGKTIFMEDRALFYGEVLSYIINLRDMNSEFGVLPIPKFDEQQDGYITYCENNSSTATIPNAGDPASAATVLEAMAIQSHMTVTPAYYEVALERKYSRDEESIEMIDIALANRIYDIGRVYTSLGISGVFQYLAAKGSTDFASAFAKREKTALKKLTTIIEAFDAME